MATSSTQTDVSNAVGVIGSLALSAVRPAVSTLALRALRWQRDLERLGVVVPFFVVHDLGLLFAAPTGQLAVGQRCALEKIWGAAQEATDLARAYEALVAELSACEAARRATSLRLSDDMVTVIVSKLVGAVARRVLTPCAYSTTVASDASLFENIESKLEGLFSSVDRGFELESLRALRQMRLYVLTVADALDLDTLRLLGVLGAEAGTGAALQVDMLAAMDSPAAHDVVNFSLEILPSVLESKTRPGATTRLGYGCGGLATQGNVDSLLLTELAYDAQDFARRVLDSEVLYYTKETEREPAGRRHLLLIDASASMRGQREVFARGMALATAKKLLLEGEEVAIRFFDSRLYDAHHTRTGRVPTPYVLSFKGERGRNPRRVFAELASSLDIEHARDRREIVLHVFTHAALYIPRELVVSIKRLAKVGIVFIQPSGGNLDLDYLDLLDAWWVVDHATLTEQKARANKARSILGEIDGREREGRHSRSPLVGPAVHETQDSTTRARSRMRGTDS